MNSIEIFRGATGLLFKTINPDSSSSQLKVIMGDNKVVLTFTLNHFADFLFGDYCNIYGEKYKVNKPPPFTKNATNNYDYTLTMEAEYYDLRKVQFLFLGSTNTLRETSFSIMGTADTFIKLILDNANRVSPTWSRGDVINTSYKNLTFSKEDCLTALQRVAEAFDTEYWIDGKEVNLTRRRNISTYSFEYGKSKGLHNITREVLAGSSLVTRLYVAGSDKNLPANYRNYTKRLKMVGGVDFLEQNLNIGEVEGSMVFDDIYPTRTGRVTAIGSDIFSFFDITMNFDINQYLLPNTNAKITFNTGQLSGYTFKIASFNGNSKEFRILLNDEEKALVIPSPSLSPAVDDEYVLVDIFLPQQYVDLAEQALQIAGEKLLEKISSHQYSYTVSIDPLFMKRRGAKITIGTEVTLVDSTIGITKSIMVVSSTRNIVNEFLFNVVISDDKIVGTGEQIFNGIASNSRDISSVQGSYSAIEDNNVMGDLHINEGSIIFNKLPAITGALTDYALLYLNRSTGKVHRAL